MIRKFRVNDGGFQGPGGREVRDRGRLRTIKNCAQLPHYLPSFVLHFIPASVHSDVIGEPVYR